MQSPPLNSLVRGLALGACTAALLNAGLPHGANAQPPAARTTEYVIHISVDGLRSDAVTTMGADNLPNFYRLRSEGAFTDNARTDFDKTTTVPNHTTQITGRGVIGEAGHNWDENDTKPPEYTIHDNKGGYVASVFDVVHDHGLRTIAAVAKPKLLIYKTSYSADHGAPDTVGEDNGPAKINRLLYIGKAPEMTDAFIKDTKSKPANYSFVHFQEPDRAGHDMRWLLDLGSPYLESIRVVDEQLGRILDLVQENPTLAGKTTVIVTADHGGLLGTKGHDVPADPQAYTIPFYVWGAGVKPGDLYAHNSTTRRDPGTGRPDYTATPQPIRNGDAPNLALKLLGLPPIPGSTINADQSLKIAPK